MRVKMMMQGANCNLYMVTQTNNTFTFLSTDIHIEVIQKLNGKDPVAFFIDFIGDDVLRLLVTETNRFVQKTESANVAVADVEIFRGTIL